MTEQESRLKVLGQIAVVQHRLDVLEDHLIGLGMADYNLSDATDDAIGNLSFQTGALIGLLTEYRDTTGSATRKRAFEPN